ncbi:MAG: SWIM zinc finger family protein [Bacteroidota bacterium]
MQWTEEQILELAPDAASVKAGKKQANLSKWLRLGATENSLWGEVQGSGSTPYQTRIDLRQIGYKCTCPSRKFPCKHAIGLLLLRARSADAFTETTPPDWVADWLNQREKREERKANPKPVDEKARQKRVASRMKKIEGGVEELQLWLKDLVRDGLATLPTRDRAFWQNTAARMVDAQAPGLANFVRRMGEINYHAAGWEYTAWQTLTQMYLVTEGFKQWESLDAGVQEDVKTALGWPYAKDELHRQAGVEDIWQILGKQEFQDERLTTIRYLLKGKTSERYALILQFIAPGQPRDTSLMPATQLEATLAFYPSNYPLRAVVKEIRQTHPMSQPEGYATLAEFEASYAQVVSFDLQTNQLPVVLGTVTPRWIGEKLLLTDSTGKAVTVQVTEEGRWKILALSGGQPITVAGIIENRMLHPLGVWAFSEYHLL